jgi:undecaprenyl diphosphate synthase
LAATNGANVSFYNYLSHHMGPSVTDAALTVPQCVGIIMDGNRRWAKERGLNPWDGHREGGKVLGTIAEYAGEQGIKHLIFYTLSTENWKRSPEEIQFLLALFREFLRDNIKEFVARGGRLRIAGQRERFPQDLQDLFIEAETKTAHGTKGTVWLALSYGGRPEITAAVNALVQSGATEVTEDMISNKLWTAGMPDPDIIIRTGGEKRLSNFLPWQGVYSELFFTDTHWPAFGTAEFQGIIDEYGTRARRFGA